MPEPEVFCSVMEKWDQNDNLVYTVYKITIIINYQFYIRCIHADTTDNEIYIGILIYMYVLSLRFL